MARGSSALAGEGGPGELQRLVDEVFARKPSGQVTKLEVVERAEIDDLPDDLREVIDLLPSATYRRRSLCDQLNSIITAHGWALDVGTVS